MQDLLQDAIGQSVSNLQAQMLASQNDLVGKLKNMKTTTAQVGLAQAIDKGTSYGASVSTLAKATANRTSTSPIVEDNRAIEDLYAANVMMRTKQLTQTEVTEVVRKVTISGGNIDDYINRMKRERDNLRFEGSAVESQYKDNYDHNIGLLEAYQAQQNNGGGNP